MKSQLARGEGGNDSAADGERHGAGRRIHVYGPFSGDQSGPDVAFPPVSSALRDHFRRGRTARAADAKCRYPEHVVRDNQLSYCIS